MGFDVGNAFEIGISVDIKKNITDLIVGFSLQNSFGNPLAYILFDDNQLPPAKNIDAGTKILKFLIPENTLAEGHYIILFDVGIHNKEKIINDECSFSFSLENHYGIGQLHKTKDNHFMSKSVFRPLIFLKK
jgi:hypothetical protein